MTDRELLELAAKAAGIHLEWDYLPEKWQPMYYEGKTYHGWNPLADDGDALRLAVKLRIAVLPSCPQAQIDYPHGPKFGAGEFDPYAATRRAIVRAAAEMAN